MYVIINPVMYILIQFFVIIHVQTILLLVIYPCTDFSNKDTIFIL